MLGYKRLQFNIIIRKVNKFAPMKNLHSMLFPILWVDEVRLRTVLIIIIVVVVLVVIIIIIIIWSKRYCSNLA